MHVGNQWLGIILFCYLKMKMGLLMCRRICSVAGVVCGLKWKWVCWCFDEVALLLALFYQLKWKWVCWCVENAVGDFCWLNENGFVDDVLKQLLALLLWLYLSNWWSYELIVLFDQVWALNSGVDIPKSEFMIMRIWKLNGMVEVRINHRQICF